MAIEESAVTIWHYVEEDADGTAMYRTRMGTSYVTFGIKSDAEHGGIRSAGIPREVISGFLLPGTCITGSQVPFFLVPDRDMIAPGYYTGYTSPDEAVAHGAKVYRVTSSVQPPRISDGTLVDWSCFEGVRLYS